MNKLPKIFMDKYGPGSDKEICIMFGIDIRELSREELMACCSYMGEMYQKQLKQGIRDREFMRELHKAGGR